MTAQEQASGIQRVSWLHGCWECKRDGQTIEEQWMRPLGGSMLGMSRTVRGTALAEYELVVLREDADRLAYEAHPSGQAAAVFKSTLIGDGKIVFENLQHDFPQRVGYERRGANMTAWIEGTTDGKVRRIEFPYTRVDCGRK
jgi:hypothetical protein